MKFSILLSFYYITVNTYEHISYFYESVTFPVLKDVSMHMFRATILRFLHISRPLIQITLFFLWTWRLLWCASYCMLFWESFWDADSNATRRQINAIFETKLIISKILRCFASLMLE